MKIRATRTMIWEYEPNLENYDGAKTADEVVAIDEDLALEDADFFFSSDDVEDEIEFEILEQ